MDIFVHVASAPGHLGLGGFFVLLTRALEVSDVFGRL